MVRSYRAARLCSLLGHPLPARRQVARDVINSVPFSVPPFLRPFLRASRVSFRLVGWSVAVVLVRIALAWAGWMG